VSTARRNALSIKATDYHTAGGPFRVVPGFADALAGRTMLEKQRSAIDKLDHVRRLLAQEPRGHFAMDGAFVTDPLDPGADFGLVFFEAGGYSTACGHGTIAAITWAIETGAVTTTGASSVVVVDVPSGRIRATAQVSNGRVRSVAFENVPSFVEAESVTVETSRGSLRVSIAFGGAFYAGVDVEATGGELSLRALPDLTALARQVKAALEARHPVRHATDPGLAGIYGVSFFREESDAPAAQRMVTIFGDGVVDRSPCGSGTCARLAVLHRLGAIRTGEWLVSRSIIGTEFRARVIAEAEVAGRPAVVPVVEGSAFLTGLHEFILQPDDPLGEGFLL
jgi:proline racemase